MGIAVWIGMIRSVNDYIQHLFWSLANFAMCCIDHLATWFWDIRLVPSHSVDKQKEIWTKNRWPGKTCLLHIFSKRRTLPQVCSLAMRFSPQPKHWHFAILAGFPRIKSSGFTLQIGTGKMVEAHDIGTYSTILELIKSSFNINRHSVTENYMVTKLVW